MWWTFPGGGVKRDETPEAAARREIKEEVGIDLAEVKKLGEFLSTRYFKYDTVYCFFSRVSKPDFSVDNGEVIEARWFDPNNFPENLSFAVPKIIVMYQESEFNRK